jgi:hypothetical protein
MARTVLILLGFYIPRGNFEVRAEMVPSLGSFASISPFASERKRFP